MNTDGERLQVEFHSKASQVFFVLMQEFEKSCQAVNRDTHEYQYQQLKRTFSSELSRNLQAIAQEILHNNKNDKNLKEIDPMLRQLSNQYLHRFVQKIDAF
jgi:hypothetical protein